MFQKGKKIRKVKKLCVTKCFKMWKRESESHSRQQLDQYHCRERFATTCYIHVCLECLPLFSNSNSLPRREDSQLSGWPRVKGFSCQTSGWILQDEFMKRYTNRTQRSRTVSTEYMVSETETQISTCPQLSHLCTVNFVYITSKF